MTLDLSQKAEKGILLLPESSGASPDILLLPVFSCNVLNLWYLIMCSCGDELADTRGSLLNSTYCQ